MGLLISLIRANPSPNLNPESGPDLDPCLSPGTGAGPGPPTGGPARRGDGGVVGAWGAGEKLEGEGEERGARARGQMGAGRVDIIKKHSPVILDSQRSSLMSQPSDQTSATLRHSCWFSKANRQGPPQAPGLPPGSHQTPWQAMWRGFNQDLHHASAPRHRTPCEML